MAISNFSNAHTIHFILIPRNGSGTVNYAALMGSNAVTATVSNGGTLPGSKSVSCEFI